MAAVMELSQEETEELLTAASLPRLQVISSYADLTDAQRRILSWWDGEPSSQTTESGAALRVFRRRAVLGAGTLMLSALGLLAWQANSANGRGLEISAVDEAQPATPTTALGIDVPPVAEISSPSENSTIAQSGTFSGTASHPAGVAHVEAILQRLDAGIYWNPIADEGRWQQRFERFIVTVDDPGAPETSWRYSFPGTLPEGEYRLRVWTRSTQGRGDPVGPLANFNVVLAGNLDAEYRKAVGAQAAAVPLTPDPEGAPKTRVQLPENGARITDPVRIRASTENEVEDVTKLEVGLYYITDDTYWNFESDGWQRTPNTITLTADADNQRSIEFDLWLPNQVLRPGSYTITATGTTASGVISSRTNSFATIDQ